MRVFASLSWSDEKMGGEETTAKDPIEAPVYGTSKLPPGEAEKALQQ